MTPHEILLVRNSFRLLVPIANQATALLYARLFELDPSLRVLFNGDMHEQGRKFQSVLAIVVGSLDRLDEVLPSIRELGVRHAGYGVQYKHYATVGAALLWTLEKALGPDFTPEVRAAWNAVYSTLAGTMICAAKEAA